jgi:DNA-binding NtrC family response regulator
MQRRATAYQAALPPSMGAHLEPEQPARERYAYDAVNASRPAALPDVFRRPAMFPLTSAEPQSAAVAVAECGAPSLEARVDVLERRIIADCLQRNNYRRKETAAELGISRVTLYNKMKKFGLM